jgi:hypothetical protein
VVGIWRASVTMTKIINLWGGPGTGKSTSSAFVFYKLKQAGYNVELVREYVKNWAWEGRHIGPYDQFYFMGKQIRSEAMLFNKVDYIVTDCPVMLGAYYAKLYSSECVAKGILSSVMSFYESTSADGHKHLNIFLNRSKPYNQAGRYENADQAKDVDIGVQNMLKELNVPYYVCDTDEGALSSLVSLVVGGALTPGA